MVVSPRWLCGQLCFMPLPWVGRGGEDLLALSAAQGSCGGTEPALDGPRRCLNQAPGGSLGRAQGGVDAAFLQLQSLRLQFCMASS